MAEIEASFSGDENIHGTLQKLFPSWERVKAAYFRQRDLLKKAAIAAELGEGTYQSSVHGSEIGRYEEIEGNERLVYLLFIVPIKYVGFIYRLGCASCRFSSIRRLYMQCDVQVSL